MVIKKERQSKSEFLVISLVLIAIGFIVFVFAAGGVFLPMYGNAAFNNTPVDYGNYSYDVINAQDTPYFINISSANNTIYSVFGNITNITCYYNETGGATNYTANLTVFSNISHNQWNNFSNPINATFNTLPDSATIPYPSTAVGYNFTCWLSNSTGDVLDIVSVVNVTIDNTNPLVSFGEVTLADDTRTNLYNWTYVNVSWTEPRNCTVTFELFYSNGSLANQTLFTSGEASTKYINWTSLDDDTYTYNVTINDSAGNSNTTASRTIILDHVSPVPTIASSSATTSSLTLTVTADGGLSGTNTSCWIEGGRSVTITGTTGTQTLTESSLGCGTSYTYQVSCGDRAGNIGTSVETSFSTSACDDSGGLSSSSPSTTTWTNTYTATSEQFKTGYTKEIAVKNRVKVKVGNTYHHVGVKEVTLTTATIEIASDPVVVKLNIEEDAKVDVTDDGYYDIYVKLLGIINGKANIIIQEIHEEIPAEIETGEGVETTGEIIEGDVDEIEESSLTWLWIVIGIILLVAIIGGGIAVKKKK